jgi:hypothetical protein
MPTRIQDLFTYALLAFFLALAFLGFANGCAASAPPRSTKWHDRVDVTAAVFLFNDESRCSGVAIDDHLILTAAHCDHMTIAVPTPGNDPRPVLHMDAFDDRDLAIVVVGGEPLPVQARIALAQPDEGDVVFAAGFGCYEELAVYPGLYIGPRPPPLVGDAYAMGVCKGDSGGPVFNDDGELVGILSERGTEAPIAIAVRP